MRSMLCGVSPLIWLSFLSASEANAQGFARARLAVESFGWGATAGEWSVEEHPRLIGDVNGDGRSDVVGFGDSGVWVSFGQPDGSLAPSVKVLDNFGAGPSGGSWGRLDAPARTHPRHLADVNADGRDDIVGFGDDGTWVSLAQSENPFGETFGEPRMVLSSFGADAAAGGWSEVLGQNYEIYPRLLGDVNGDGQDDIIGFSERGVSVALATGNGGFAEPNRVLNTFGASRAAGGWDGFRHPRLLGDVNGDGQTDIVGFGERGTSVSLGQADGTFTERSQVLASFGAHPAAGNWAAVVDVDGIATTYPRLLGDVNGDNRSDIIGFGNRGTWVALGQSDGSFSTPAQVLDYFGAAPNAGGFRYGDDARLVADVNGDGRDDIVGMGRQNTQVSLSLSDGTFSSPFVAVEDFGRALGADHFWSYREPRLLADVNGDSRADIIGFREDGVFVAVAQGLVPGAENPAADPNQEVLDIPPLEAKFLWSVPDRYAASWDAHEEGAYDRAYVRPELWSVTINACRSTGGGAPIQEFRFEIAGVGFDYEFIDETTGCLHQVETLPRLGTYRLAVQVRTEYGWSDPTVEVIERVDWLIVSLGDSFASGEANPDEPGRYDVISASIKDPVLHEEVPVIWQDPVCHRTARSAHAMAAEELERRDPHSSVTFLSYACTGDETEDVFGDVFLCYWFYGENPEICRLDYECGEGEPDTCGRFEPRPGRSGRTQLVSLWQDLGLAEVRPTGGVRDVDAVLMTIGINEFDFSGLILDCATPETMFNDEGDCLGDRGDALLALPKQLQLIDRVLDELPGDPEIYLSEYPYDPLHGGGCGFLNVLGRGISSEEGEKILRLGDSLNVQMSENANKLGWNFVGVFEAFRGHHYCSPAPYYRSFEESLVTQGDKLGTLHPNARGQAAHRDLLLDAIVLAPSFEPWKRATLVVDQIRLAARVGPEPKVAVVVVTDQDETIGDRSAHSQVRHFAVQRFGEWIDVPSDEGTFTFGLYLPPVPPRYPEHIYIHSGGAHGEGNVPEVHLREDNYGFGSHEVQDDDFAIRYHIEIADVARPCPSPGPRQPGFPVAPVPCEFEGP